MVGSMTRENRIAQISANFWKNSARNGFRTVFSIGAGCVKWLADGNYTPNEWDYDPYGSFRDGCMGNCGREHPRLVLSFDAATKTTVATVTHPELLPFQNYFEERVNEETAWVRDRSSYDLNGFIRENLTNLRTQRHFGRHLVSVADGALEASDAAQREQGRAPYQTYQNW